MNDSLKAHFSLFSAQLIYAMNYIIAKDLMPVHISPLALVFLRMSGACILFWLLSLFTAREKLDIGDLKKMAILALFGVFINQTFFIYGLNLTHPINSAIIMISNPIMVLVFTLIVFKEKITLLKISGLSLGIAGAMILLLFRGNFEFGSETIIGDAMTLINSASWAVFVVMAKPYMMKYQTVTVMKWVFLFGTIYMTPLGIYDIPHVKWHEMSANVWLAIAFVVIATTFFAYLLNTYALKALSSTVVSTYIYLQPFMTTIFAVFLGKDNLTPIKILAAFFIISGVYMVSFKKKTSITNNSL